MKRTNGSFSKLVATAALLLAAIVTNAQSGDPVTIKSVDNYAGNSNVYTDKPNTAIKVTELDADKKPVRSWTGTTDGDGKITIPAGSNLSVPYLRAVTADPKNAEFVTPTSIDTNEPFLFTATGTLQGEVVNIQSVSGEVVARPTADKYGRVLLQSGLAAGSYILSTGKSDSCKVATIKIQPRVYEYDAPSRWITFDRDFVPVDCSKFGVIQGRFTNPQLLEIDDFTHDRTLRPLAATPRQIVLPRASDNGIKPGLKTITVRDTQTGQQTMTNIVVYKAEAKLTQVKVPSGAETHLLIMVTPRLLEGEAGAQVVSGPVTLANGQGAMTLPLKDGEADFRIQSKPGAQGEFDVHWWFKPDPDKKYKWHLWEPKKYKSHLWEPPKTGGVNIGGNADGKKDEPVKEPPRRGGDTKALEPDWEPFEEKDEFGKIRKGRRLIKHDGDTRTETKIYEGGDLGDTSHEVSTTSGDTKTDSKKTTDATGARGSGDRTETEESTTSKKGEDGKWKVESGEKTVKEFKGGKLVDEKKYEWKDGKWVPKR